jgi:predicted transcriptional regulator of viral defense system
MSNLALTLRDSLPFDVFTDTEVMCLLGGNPDRRYGLVKRALAKGDLIQLRRGVYCLGKRWQRRPLNLFDLAQRVYPPSYVSMESALSYHGWIPEAVYTVASVSMRRSVAFETPVGVFNYTRIPRFNFAGVERVKEGGVIFLMATPTKALVDYVLAKKLDVKGPNELVESLRIDSEKLGELSQPLVAEIVSTYKSRRAQVLAKTLRRMP